MVGRRRAPLHGFGHCCLLALILAVRAAAAQPTTADKSAVLGLYEEAKALMEKGEYALARDKLEEGKRLDPSTIGLQLRLADCYERNHQPASAWTQYIEVAALAQRSGDSRRELALERAAALANLVPKLAIIVPPEATAAGVEIRRNGTAVGKALWGTAVPTDPGEYTIEARYDKGNKPYRAEVRVESAGATVEVRIPTPIEDEPETPSATVTAAQPAVSPAPVPSPRRWSPRRVGGIATTTIGVSGVLAGIGLGAYVIDKYTASSPYCNAQDKCSQTGFDLRHQAIVVYPASLVSLSVGMAAVIAGVVLLATNSKGSSPRAAGSAWRSVLSAAPSGVSLSW
jgi:hypothetical protein